LGKATPEDWIVVDFVGSSWEAVQEWYVGEIYRQDIDEFFMDARKNMRSGNPLDGWKDWSIINRAHKSFMNDLIHRNPAHTYLTAVGEPLRDTDDKALKATFGAFGIRPKGQKHLGHQVHTILLLQTMRPGEWYMNTIKDRERTPHEGTKLKDFVVDYLVATASWRL
jgi:hypothetical protein